SDMTTILADNNPRGCSRRPDRNVWPTRTTFKLVGQTFLSGLSKQALNPAAASALAGNTPASPGRSILPRSAPALGPPRIAPPVPGAGRRTLLGRGGVPGARRPR